MNDHDEDARAEWRSCDHHETGCETGAPVSFGPNRLELRPGQRAAIQFPHAGMRHHTVLLRAWMTFEMMGSTELFGHAGRQQEHADLTLDIQVELSAQSLPLQDREFDITSRELSNSTISWTVPPQQQHERVVTPDLSPLLNHLRFLDNWSEQSTVTLVLTPKAGHGRRVFQCRDQRTEAVARRSHMLVSVLLYAVLSPLLLHFLQTFRGVDQWVSAQHGLSRTLTNAGSMRLHPEPIARQPWGVKRWSLIVFFVGFAVAFACARAVKFGRESWFEALEGQEFAAMMDGLLAASAAWVGLLMVLWICVFALTCIDCASAINHSAKSLSDTNSLDMTVEHYRKHAMDTIYLIDKVADDLNDAFQAVQLLCCLVFFYLLYTQLVATLLEDSSQDARINGVYLVIYCAAIIATFLPAAMVTAATEEVSYHLLIFAERCFCSDLIHKDRLERSGLAEQEPSGDSLEVTGGDGNGRSKSFRLRETASSTNKIDLLSAEVTMLLAHAANKQMGYRLFESFLVSYDTIRRFATVVFTVCVAVNKARGL